MYSQCAHCTVQSGLNISLPNRALQVYKRSVDAEPSWDDSEPFGTDEAPFVLHLVDDRTQQPGLRRRRREITVDHVAGQSPREVTSTTPDRAQSYQAGDVATWRAQWLSSLHRSCGDGSWWRLPAGGFTCRRIASASSAWTQQGSNEGAVTMWSQI